MSSIPSPPQPGRPAGPFITNAAMWRDIVAMLTWWKKQPKDSGFRQNVGACVPMGKSASERNLGYVYQPQNAPRDPGSVEVLQTDKYNPTLTLEDPVWHSSIDNIGVLYRSLPEGNCDYLGISRFVPVEVTVVQETDRYVMPRHDDPTKLKTADRAGMFKIKTLYPLYGGVRVAVIDVLEGYYYWIFELTEDWADASSTAAAKLLRWDLAEFAPNITVEDPLSMFRDMTSGMRGFCHHQGNHFVASQAPCVPGVSSPPTTTPDPGLFPDPT